MWSLHWLRILLLDGNIGKRKISNNEVRYFLISEVLKTKPTLIIIKPLFVNPLNMKNSRKLLFQSLRIFLEDRLFLCGNARPCTTANGTAVTKNEAGWHFSFDKRRRRFMKNPAALWWIAGSERKI